MIYASVNKVEDYECGVTGCIVKMGKICTHITPKCVNYGGKYQNTTFRCPARAKAQAKA